MSEATIRAGLNAAGAAVDAEHQPGIIRSLLDRQLPNLGPQEVVDALKDNKCILCQQANHSVSKCPLFRRARGDLHATCVRYKRAFFDAAYAPK